jgi:fructoselysine-6-P-deglycase FrlB-like protein
MRKEIEEIPLAIERLLSAPENKIQKAADAMRDLNPKLITTFAGQGLQS